MDNHKRATLKLAGTAFACGVTRWATAQPASAPTTGPDGGGLDPYPGGYRVKAPPVPAGEPDIVRVREGQLQGVRAGDIRYFRSVPFAKPPVGDLRFLPPQPGARLHVVCVPRPGRSAGKHPFGGMSRDTSLRRRKSSGAFNRSDRR